MATGTVSSRAAPVTPATPSGGGSSNLQPGQSLVARVVEVLDSGMVRLATRDASFDVKPTVPLAVGTRVLLQVEGSGHNLKLVVHADPEAVSKGAAQPNGGNTATASRPVTTQPVLNNAPAVQLATSAVNSAVVQSTITTTSPALTSTAPQAYPVPGGAASPPTATTVPAGTNAAASTSQTIAGSTSAVSAGGQLTASAPTATGTTSAASTANTPIGTQPPAPANTAPTAGGATGTAPATNPPTGTQPTAPANAASTAGGATGAATTASTPIGMQSTAPANAAPTAGGTTGAATTAGTSVAPTAPANVAPTVTAAVSATASAAYGQSGAGATPGSGSPNAVQSAPTTNAPAAPQAAFSQNSTASISATPTAGVPQTATGPSPPPLSQDAAHAALSKMVHDAVARQDGLAPLFANLSKLAGAQNRLPDTIMRAVEQLLGLRLATGGAPSTASVQKAVQQSGIFQEARLAATTGGTLPSGDMKSSLLLLRSVLQSWIGSDPAASKQSTERPLPPRRGAMPNGQRPSLPTLLQAMTPQETLRVLLSQTEAALERIRLSQFASRKEDGDPNMGRAHGAHSEWTFEIPLALNQDTAIVQMLLERDGATGAADDEQTWRLRFSIDIEPLGPIHVQLSLHAGDVAVTIWAEKDEARQKLRDSVSDLREALHEAELGVDDIQLLTGRPGERANHSGSLVDKRT